MEPLETNMSVQPAAVQPSLTEDARQSVLSARMRGVREGTANGFAEGRETELAAGRRQEEALRAAQATQTARLREETQEKIRQMRANLPKQAEEATRGVLRAALAHSDEAFLSLFAQAAAHVRAAGHAVLRASRHDCAIAVRHMDILKRAVDGLEELELRPADGVEDGCCVLETAAGSVDVGVWTQLRKAMQIAGWADAVPGEGEGHEADAGD